MDVRDTNGKLPEGDYVLKNMPDFDGWTFHFSVDYRYSEPITLVGMHVVEATKTQGRTTQHFDLKARDLQDLTTRLVQVHKYLYGNKLD